VLYELLEAEVDEVVGPKGRHNPDRTAVRHGHEGGGHAWWPPRAGESAACPQVVLGVHTPVQRCIRHKERNVLGHLPERDQSVVRRRLCAAWALDDHDRALDQLGQLADALARTHPGAASSLREDMQETLTITRPASAAGSRARSLRGARASR
jgi:hypothetical protein